uniref:Reverse transcriptase/retrotransposon-derived protein RNase H-like domain-containing protein n=1 Tax=Ditylenchus dipsaci TaxID=166011 RepID=A0A915E8N9_9BILA
MSSLSTKKLCVEGWKDRNFKGTLCIASIWMRGSAPVTSSLSDSNGLRDEQTPRFGHPFIMETDASAKAIAAILLQENPQHEIHRYCSSRRNVASTEDDIVLVAPELQQLQGNVAQLTNNEQSLSSPLQNNINSFFNTPSEDNKSNARSTQPITSTSTSEANESIEEVRHRLSQSRYQIPILRMMTPVPRHQHRPQDGIRSANGTHRGEN